MAPKAGPVASPALIVIDGEGIVRWIRQVESYLERPGPDEVLNHMQRR